MVLTLISLGVLLVSECFSKSSAQTWSYNKSAQIRQQHYWLTYQDRQNRVAIDYPEDWQIENQSNVISGMVVRLLSPPSDLGYHNRQEVIISIYSMGRNWISLEEYSELSLRQIREKNPEYEGVRLELLNTTLANQRANSVMYQRYHNGYEVNVKEVWTVYQGKVYMVTCISDRYSWWNFATVDEMIRSLKIQHY